MSPRATAVATLESETCQEIAAWLRDQKWVVKVAAYNKRMPSGLVGIGDILAWKDDYNLIVEVKSLTGRRRESQAEFWLAIRKTCPDALHVIYVLVTGLWAVQDELRHRGLYDPESEETHESKD